MREGILSGGVEPPGRSRKSRGSRGGGGGGSRGGRGGGRRNQRGNPLGRGFFFPLRRGGRDLSVSQTRTGRVLYPREERGNGGVAPICEVGGLPRGGVGISEGLRVTVVFVGGVVMPGEVGMQARRGGRGFSGRGGRGWGLIGRGGWGSV